MDFLHKVEHLTKSGKLEKDLALLLYKFYLSYAEALRSIGKTTADHQSLLKQLVDMVVENSHHPVSFSPFHRAMRSPIDYYQFGIDFIRPLVILEKSKIFHPKNLDKIEKQLAKGENVILLANHQTELDPQAISLMLEKNHPQLAEEMIFVAGHRVISDPLAIPFSKGRHLLCIYSKKHIEHPPELKQEKLLHNKRTMNRMSELLSQGGRCIYVAPSGGRDRMGSDGKIDVAKFDPQSIEMFRLIAEQSAPLTHFYPLALVTYDLLPPPQTVDIQLGEQRHTQCTPIHLAFGNELEMDHFPGSEGLDKKSKRPIRAEYIWELVNKDYQHMTKHS